MVTCILAVVTALLMPFVLRYLMPLVPIVFVIGAIIAIFGILPALFPFVCGFLLICGFFSAVAKKVGGG